MSYCFNYEFLYCAYFWQFFVHINTYKCYLSHLMEFSNWLLFFFFSSLVFLSHNWISFFCIKIPLLSSLHAG